MGKMIGLAEYAKKVGRSQITIRQRCQRGAMKTAYKTGGTWLIDEDEPLTDARMRNGEYVGWRMKTNNKE